MKQTPRDDAESASQIVMTNTDWGSGAVMNQNDSSMT